MAFPQINAKLCLNSVWTLIQNSELPHEAENKINFEWARKELFFKQVLIVIAIRMQEFKTTEQV